jgi:hypothetical protein
MFPNPHNTPSPQTKFSNPQPVALNVPHYFSLPIEAIGRGNGTATLAAMPKTAVHKYCQPHMRKGKSGLPMIEYCRRQPVTWEMRRAAASAISVERFPFERIAAIMRERWALVKISAIGGATGFNFEDSFVVAYGRCPKRSLPLAEAFAMGS